MSNPVAASHAKFQLSANSIEAVCDARVILGVDGRPKATILSTKVGEDEVKITFPGYAFPFVRNGGKVLVVTTVVQVSSDAPTAATKLLLPGD